MSFDASLHALLLRNKGTDRRLQFAQVPAGLDCRGEWAVRMIEINGEEWPWLTDLPGVQSRCVRHLHSVLAKNGFQAARHVSSPMRKKARSGTVTHWYWKASFHPDSDMVDMDTPPRVLATKSSHRELGRKLQRERARNETLCRCLRVSEQKRTATHEEMVQRLLTAANEKQALMGIVRSLREELDCAKRLLDMSDLSDIPLSPVQVDQMLTL